MNVYQDLALTEASAQMALDRLNWNLNRTGVATVGSAKKQVNKNTTVKR